MNLKPLMHPVVAAELERFIASNHHALALVGPYGAGKTFLANWLAKRLLGSDKPSLHQLKRIVPQNGAIGIDSIRGAQNFLKLKSASQAEISRVIIIEEAESMTREAQNALLKLLEEPPEGVRIILTVVGEHSLLPTVYSRLHSAKVLPITQNQAYDYFSNKDQADINKALALSGGYAGLCFALLEDSDHQLRNAISDAKKFINQPVYDRLIEIDRLSKNKEAAKTLLFALKRVVTSALESSASRSSRQQTTRLINSLKAIHLAETAIARNSNLKLTLTNVMLNL